LELGVITRGKKYGIVVGEEVFEFKTQSALLQFLRENKSYYKALRHVVLEKLKRVRTPMPAKKEKANKK